MKKQILLFSCLVILLSFFGACKTDKPETTSTTTTSTIGATGIPTIDALSQKIADNPADPKLFATRAKAFYENEGYDNAIQDMAMAMRMDSTNADYHHLLTEIYLDYYKSRLALQTMKRCVALHPERIPSLLKLAEVQQILKMYDASMSTIGRIMKIDSDNAEGFFMVGLNHTLMGNKDLSIKSLKKCVELDPDHTDAWILLGKIFEEDGDPLAKQYYDNAVAIAPDDVDVLYNQASYLHNQNQLDASVSALKKIVKLDRNYVDAYQRMGIIYIEKDSLDKAYDSFNIAVKVDPEFGLAYYYRGLTSEMKGDFQAAKTDFQNILNFDAGYTKAAEGLARVNKALENK